jgi:hypothetical protein
MLTTSPERGLLQLSSNNNNTSSKPLERTNTIEESSSETDNDTDDWSTCSEPLPKKESVIDMARKAGVAVGGGAMVGLGLVMIPLPTPFGCVVAGAGMGVLATEFPAAQQMIDQTRDAVVDVIEKNCNDVDDDDDEEDVGGENDDNHNDTQRSSRKEEGFVLLQKDGQDVKETYVSEDGHPFDEVARNFDFAAKTFKKSVNRLGQKALPVLKSIGKENNVNESLRNSNSTTQQCAYEAVPVGSPITMPLRESSRPA